MAEYSYLVLLVAMTFCAICGCALVAAYVVIITKDLIEDWRWKRKWEKRL